MASALKTQGNSNKVIAGRSCLVNVGSFASPDASASVVSECDSPVNDVED